MNENCLEGWKCPKCGNEDPFWINVTEYKTVLMGDDGTIEEKSGAETYWTADSYAKCGECGFEASPKVFAPELYKEGDDEQA